MKSFFNRYGWFLFAAFMTVAIAYGEIDVSNKKSSNEFKINAAIQDQPFFFQDSEPIYYSGSFQTYDASAAKTLRVTVTTDGETTILKEATPDEVGLFELRPADYQIGYHILNHNILNASDKVLTSFEKGFAIVDPEKVELHMGELLQDETWSTNKIHIVCRSFFVRLGVTLTIDPGTIVKFCSGASINIDLGGSCIANGPVFTHINDDSVGGDTLMDGGSEPPIDSYAFSGDIYFREDTDFRFINRLKNLTGSVFEDLTLSPLYTYTISKILNVNGCDLIIPPGTVIKMDSNASIILNKDSNIKAFGTRSAPIIITSIKDDTYNGDTNGDGNDTYPDVEDWKGIQNFQGNITMEYVSIFYAETAINCSSFLGNIVFNNSTIGHSADCGIQGGCASICNSTFYDVGWALAPSYNSSCVNSVFYDISYFVNGYNCNFKNCIVYKFAEVQKWSYDYSTFSNCIIWNPEGFGPQSSDKTGIDNNIWADPLFRDPDNGDFRTYADSPCVDAADSDAAPEFDYFGQPRITVTKGHDGEKPLADIGIYEVMPNDATSDIDLIPISVSADTNAEIGSNIYVEWQIKNDGAREINSSWRDTVSLITEYGSEIKLGDHRTKAKLAKGETLLCSGYFSVPALNEGTYYPKVNLNSYHDIFEGINTTNNALKGEQTVNISIGSTDLDTPGEGTINPGKPTIIKLHYDETNDNRMVRFSLPKGVKISWGFGFMPMDSYSSGSVTAGDNDVLFLVPDGSTDVYVVLEGDKESDYKYSSEKSGMVITSVSPTSLPSSGTTTLVITGGGFGENNTVTLFNASLNIELGEFALNENGCINAIVDCSLLKAGNTYSLKVDSEKAIAILPDAINVTSAAAFVDLVATIEAPSSMRLGRSTVVYINYENKGNVDLPAPIFELNFEGQVFVLGDLKYTNTVKVVGLSKDAPVGMLRPNKPQRMAVQVLLMSNNTQWRLTAHHAWQGRAKTTKISLREFFDDEWIIYHESEDDELISKLRASIGLKWSDFYNNFGIWLSDVEPEIVDYEVLKYYFSQYNYLKNTGRFDDDNVAEDIYSGDIKTNKNIIAENHNHVSRFKHPMWKSFVGNDRTIAGEDGTIWKWCTLCDCFYLAYDYDSSTGKTYIEPINSKEKTYIICHGNSDEIGGKWVSDMAKAIYRRNPKSNILAINWGDGANMEMGLPHLSAMFIPSTVIQAIGNLKLLEKLSGFVPEETTLIGHSHGGHVCANIITRWGQMFPEIIDREYQFERFVGLDVSTTDIWTHKWNQFDPASWINLINSFCKQTEFYKTTFDLSLEERDQLFGQYNFLVFRGAKDFIEMPILYSRLTGGLWLGGWWWEHNAEDKHNFSYKWFINTIIGKEYYKNLGFNFNAENDESWKKLAGDDILPPRGEKCFAGVIRNNECEFLSSRDNRSPWRYRETAINNQLSIPQSYESKSMRVSYWAWFNTADIKIGSIIPNEIYSGDRINVYLSNKADNYSIDYNELLNVKLPWPSANPYIFLYQLLKPLFDEEKRTIKKYLYYYHGTVTAWLVDLEGLGVTNKIKTISELQEAFKKVKNPAQYYRKLDSTVCDDFPKPGGNDVSTNLKINVDDHIFGPDKSLVKDERRVLLVLSSGNVYDLDTMYAPTWDLYYQNNFVLKEVKIKKATSCQGVICWIKDLFSSTALRSHNKPNDSGRLELKDNQRIKIDAAQDGTWSVRLDSLNSVATGAQITISEFTLPDADHKKGTVSLAYDYNDMFKVTVSGQLPKDTDKDGNLVCEGERYTVQLRVATEYGEDITKCILDVRGSKDDEPGEEEDTNIPRFVGGYDPNEISGPVGLGDQETQRFVIPGEWLNYTVYFENTSNATAAAQEVYVTNPLSEYLDWETFEMCEIAFNNQIDLGLSGKQSGSSEVEMTGTNYLVRTELELDKEKGEASWYMRIVDPSTDTGWPTKVEDGFLPPNDETHCGEGHLYYRIKVREDAPGNAVITNSASIIFDYNDPIETDPSWWNKVAQMQEVSIEGGSNATFIVGLPYGDLPIPEPRKTWIFVGWFTGPNGTGRLITRDSIVEEGDTALYQYWIRDGHYLDKEDETDAEVDTYNGYVFDPNNHSILGSILVKVANPKDGTAKITGTIIWAGGQKEDIKESMAMSTNRIDTRLKNGKALTLIFSSNGLIGTLENYEINGSRNVFISKDPNDKALANAALTKVKGVYALAWQEGEGYVIASVSVGNKGKAKAVGYTASGVKFSAKGQLLLGKEENCVNFVSESSKTPLAFNLWFCSDTSLDTEGPQGTTFASRLGPLAYGSSFICSYLEEPIPISVTGNKWTNQSSKQISLKLSYKESKGTFKGSFNTANGKATVNGVVVEGIGYGSATTKLSGAKAVLIK